MGITIYTPDIHQQNCITQILQAVRNGRSSVCVVPTGGGKSVIAALAISEITDRKILFLAHRIELVNQFSKHLDNVGIKHGILTADTDIAGYLSNNVVVASFNTLSSRISSGRILPEESIIFADECFTPNTKVCNKNISEIKTGDIVPSYCEKSKNIVESKVISTSKRQFDSDLFLIVSNRSRIVCTGEHPIMTSVGWVKARDINRGEHELLHLRERNRRNKKDMLKRMLIYEKLVDHGKNKYDICKRENEKKKSNAHKRNKRTRKRNIDTDWAQTNRQRRERESSISACNGNIQQNKTSRCYYRTTSKDKAYNNGYWISYMLQIRYRNRIKKDRDRNRRPFSFNNKGKNSRQEKRRFTDFRRVDYTKILKYGSDEFNREMCGENYVYNLEIENTNTYVASGVIVHNCHHILARTFRDTIESYKSAGSVIIGLTATPERLDGRGLFPLVEHIIMGPSPMDLIRSKRLVAAKIYSTDFPDLSKVTVSQGDFSRSESFELIQNTPITGRAIDHYINHAPGTKAIVFCINIKHAELVTAQFREHGINAVSVHSKSDNRDKIIHDFRDGIIQVLVTVDLISEGFDLPECEAAILLRPTMSLPLFLQQCGRVLRASPGKRWAIIIDAVGSVYRHGVPWQDREWSIYGRKAREEKSGSIQEIKIARCSKCFGCYDAKREACPFCGSGKQHKQRVIKTVDGNLRLMYDVEIDAMEAEAARIESEKAAEVARKAAVKLTVKSARTKADLERIAKENGYKPGWVYYWCRLKRIPI